MPQLESEEISFEELQSMESERMAGKLGSSGNKWVYCHNDNKPFFMQNSIKKG